MPDSLDRQAEYLRNRLTKRDRHLRKWARRDAVECYRVYDRDIPEIPLAVDRYGPYLHIALYERPYDKPEDEERVWLERMGATAAECLGVPMDRVFQKIRKRQRGTDQYDRLSEGGQSLIVREGGLSFYINLSDYLDTGLFLDHRITRSRVRKDSEGRRVLNLFCYTGSFSVYAAAGRADSVVSVDLSRTYLSWAERNMRLNGFSDSKYSFVRENVLSFLSCASRAGEKFDLVILDPPTFSNSKRMEAPMDLMEDWPSLVNGCLAVLAPGGALWFSTNARRFRFDGALLPGVLVSDETIRTTSPDFEGSHAHRCWRLARPGVAL